MRSLFDTVTSTNLLPTLNDSTIQTQTKNYTGDQEKRKYSTLIFLSPSLRFLSPSSTVLINVGLLYCLMGFYGGRNGEGETFI